MLSLMLKKKNVYAGNISERKLLRVVTLEEGRPWFEGSKETHFSLPIFCAVFTVISIPVNKEESLWTVPFAVSCYLFRHLKYSR